MRASSSARRCRAGCSRSIADAGGGGARRSRPTPASSRSTACSLDEEQTARAAARFFANFDRRVAVEAEMIRGLGVDLVVGDIPPLAFAAAARAGVPVGGDRQLHLGLDLQHLSGVRPGGAGCHPGHPPRLRHGDPRAAAAAARRLRADGGRHRGHPVHRAPIDARSCRDAAAARHRRRSAGRAAVVRRLRRESAARGAATSRIDSRSSSRCSEPPAGLLYQDLVAAADVVVSKPGYGIVSECVANEHRAALHLARPLHRIRPVRGGDAADPAVPLPLAGRSARRPVG